MVLRQRLSGNELEHEIVRALRLLQGNDVTTLAGPSATREESSDHFAAFFGELCGEGSAFGKGMFNLQTKLGTLSVAINTNGPTFLLSRYMSASTLRFELSRRRRYNRRVRRTHRDGNLSQGRRNE